MAKVVDVSVARFIALKRIGTGALSLVFGVALIVALAVRGNPPPLAGIALILFFGGGAWTLRDGIRLRREVRRVTHP